MIFTSRPFLKTAGGIVLGSVTVSADVLPYISVAIKANFLKLGMCNICKNNIAKMFLDIFKILNCSARGISKTAGWIFTKFALQVHLRL